ncbi:MAG TPA: hypothetical protein VNM91_04385 [Dehalococcoidia bacterium]|nr:hypothetical protein [Dehalococcoidia bacterium]
MGNPDELTAYLNLLRSKGWTVDEIRPGDHVELPPEIRGRYPRIPEQYERFLARVRTCVNADETTWFLCAEDFHQPASDDSFTWNEFERMELDDGGPRAADPAEVRRFWDEHMPFMLSVGGEYQYLGFRVGNDRFGSVVEGYDIDLRDPTDIAADFDEFMRLHTNALNGDAGNTTLFDYV